MGKDLPARQAEHMLHSGLLMRSDRRLLGGFITPSLGQTINESPQPPSTPLLADKGSRERVCLFYQSGTPSRTRLRSFTQLHPAALLPNSSLASVALAPEPSSVCPASLPSLTSCPAIHSRSLVKPSFLLPPTHSRLLMALCLVLP